LNKRRVRRITALISFLLFPVTLNFFSPYVSVDGAMAGIVSGSLLLFGLFFLFGIFFGRAWCSYGCPWAAPSEYLMKVNNKPVNRKRLAVIRYLIFFIWFSVLVLGFVLAGGIKSVDPLHLTDSLVSVDEPIKYMTYYMVLLLLFLCTVLIGKRGACHSICWMSPFMVGGMIVGETLGIRRFKVQSKPENCISCKKCSNACPMSIDVMNEMKSGSIGSKDCILCGECVDACPKDVLKIRMEQR
jgi:ferredoxin-type protein NapH